MSCDNGCGKRGVRLLAELLLALVDDGVCKRCDSSADAGTGGGALGGAERLTLAIEDLVDGSSGRVRRAHGQELRLGSGDFDVDGGDVVVECKESGRTESVSRVGGRVVTGGPAGGPRGPNWERNRASRDKKKRQKQMRNAHCASPLVGAGGSDFVGAEHCASLVGAGSHAHASVNSDMVRDNQEGFWNSCSKEVRQELIDSKARMHIAENLKKAKKAEEEVRQMESPGALLVRAMDMVTMAEECAKKSNDSKVAGWAQTVATSYAESIAKSAPSSVPSYASVVSGSSTTSVSVDGTKRVKSRSVQDGQKPKHAHANLTAKQSVDMFGLRLSESRTERDLDKILSDAADDPRIVGFNLERIVTISTEKRRKFQRAAERAEIQRLGGAA